MVGPVTGPTFKVFGDEVSRAAPCAVSVVVPVGAFTVPKTGC